MKFLKKIADLFRNKKFVSWFAVCVAAIVMASSVIGIMVPSYTNWKNYYDTLVGEREHQKYLQSLPLECTGITAELSDNVTYYANGKARPKSDDFVVIAHFTEKGNAFDEILQSNNFSVSYGNDFAANGGEVTVKYTFVPQVKEDESDPPPAPEPKEFTADVNCSLEAVVPVSVKRTALPYMITYGDDTPFDKAGMKAEVTFNDGSKETVGEKEFEVVNTAALTVGTNEVEVIWERGGTELKFTCPVTVVPAAQFDNGFVTALESGGRVYVEPGSNTADAVVPVRGVYESGNRLLLEESMYSVRGNTEKASFAKKCILSVFLKTDSSIFFKTTATVKSGIEAESAEGVEDATLDVEEYALSAGEYVSAGEIQAVAPVNGTRIRFNVTCEGVAKPEFSVRMALKPKTGTGAPEEGEQLKIESEDGLKLSDVLVVRVNDITVKLPESLTLHRAFGAEDKYVFYDLTFPAPVLQKQVNAFDMYFIGKNASRIVIDRVDLETGYKGVFYSSSEAYLVANSMSGETAEYGYTVIRPFGAVGGKPYGHSICSDGTYLYMLGTSWSASNRAAKVIKYDPSTNTEIAASKDTEVMVQEYCAGITYYDSKIIIYFTDGRRMYVGVDEFTDGCEFKEYDGFEFEGLTNREIKDGEGNVTQAADVIKDVYYNAAKSRFAVYSGDKLYLYNKDLTKIKELTLAKESNIGGSPRRISGSVDYIYASYTKDGQYQPVVHVYDWEGEHIGKVTIPVSATFLEQNGVAYNAKTNIQALAVINGDFYATLLRFGTENGSDSSMFLKIAMPEISEALDPDLKLNEYLKQCNLMGVTPKLIGSPSAPNFGKVEGTSGYAMGGAFDGKYLYIANNANGNSAVKVSKVDISDNTIMAQSNLLNLSGTASTQDNSRMFIKDGKLYLTAGKVYSVALADFIDNCTFQEDAEMTALLSMDGSFDIKSACYSAENDRYAVMTYNSKLLVLGSDGSLLEMRMPWVNGQKLSSVCCDDGFIYLSFTANNLPSTTVQVYRWDGSFVRSVGIEGVNLGDGNYNVQSIYMVDGELHCSVCTWDANKVFFYDWTLKGDATVFPS